MLNLLIIWNKTPFATVLAGQFGRENVVSKSSDFARLVERINTYDALIILCELGWSLSEDKVALHELSGIELVKHLRRESCINIPVLFVSFLPIATVINAEREIITAIGHEFLQLPATPDDFTAAISNRFEDKGIINRLTEMELIDIQSFYCSKEGILSHELHQLSGYLNYTITAENHQAVYFTLENSIRRIHQLFLEDSTNALRSFQSEYPELTKDTITEAVQTIIQSGNRLLKKYGGKINGKEPKNDNAEQYRWKVLLLDDEINDQHELIKLMIYNNINVICVNNASDAKSILLDDWNTENRIMVVIADYRLYEHNQGIKRHQRIQGYQFLKDIASSDHLVRLMAFSGLQRKFLLNSFKHFNIRTEVKSKTDYLSSEQARQIFCDEIIEMAEENLEVIEDMPSKCAGFKKYIEDAYKAFRMHPDYYKMESNVSLTAKEYVWEIKQQINAGEEIRIGSIENIKTPLAKTKKDEEAFFKRLNNYLIARRIALWLYATNRRGQIVNIDSRKIAEILTDQKYTTDAYRQIISTNLGLSLDDFPKNITIEERRWLQYDMQLNIFRDINLIEPVFNEIEKYFKDFLTSNNELKESIIKNRFSLNLKYKQANYSIGFTKDFVPDIKTATDVRVLFLIVATHIKKDNTKIEQIKPLVSRLRHALFVNRDYVIYLKNLFQYFNTLYRILNKEQTILSNVSSKVIDKSIFTDKSKHSINKVYERTYELLVNLLLPNENDTADVFSVFITGEGVLDKLGKKTLLDKVKFFTELTKAINNENNSLGYSFNDAFRNNNFFENDNEDENFSIFLKDEEFN
ncbi:MAG: hypothetical protein WCL70_03355 [Paludibacter sp.]